MYRHVKCCSLDFLRSRQLSPCLPIRGYVSVDRRSGIRSSLHAFRSLSVVGFRCSGRLRMTFCCTTLKLDSFRAASFRVDTNCFDDSAGPHPALFVLCTRIGTTRLRIERRNSMSPSPTVRSGVFGALAIGLVLGCVACNSTPPKKAC